MSNQLNVNGSDDPSYRYKMPKLIGKVEGRGNGIKTVIANCNDVAASLGRPSAQVCKFFGCELGAQSKFDVKNDKAIVNGAFDTTDMQKMLFKFIEKFVLCPACGNPETVQSVKGKKKAATIMLTCKACGAVEEADNQHKLCTFIIKELSGVSSKGKEKKGKKSKEDKAAEKAKKKEKKEKKKLKKEAKKAKKAAAAKAGGSDEESDPDTDAEGPVVATMESMMIDDSGAIDTVVQRLVTFLGESDRSPGEITTEVEDLVRNSGLPASARIRVLYLATVGQDPVNSMVKYGTVFASLVLNSSTGQTDMIKAFELAVEYPSLNAMQRAALLMATPLLVKALHDNDLVEERNLLAWFDSSKAKTSISQKSLVSLKNGARPIINWMRESDDEESEEEDEEESEGGSESESEGEEDE